MRWRQERGGLNASTSANLLGGLRSRRCAVVGAAGELGQQGVVVGLVRCAQCSNPSPRRHPGKRVGGWHRRRRRSPAGGAGRAARQWMGSLRRCQSLPLSASEQRGMWGHCDTPTTKSQSLRSRDGVCSDRRRQRTKRWTTSRTRAFACAHTSMTSGTTTSSWEAAH